MGKGRGRISLCMIVRDEQSILGRCLDAARPFVDEIVVVDTGSSDGTVSVAQQGGATVHHYPWGDDFAAARNFAIEQASGDWILSLDADEVLSPDAGHALRRLAGRKDCAGAYIPLRDSIQPGHETVSLMFRFWRNDPQIRWKYRLHEQILPSILVWMARHPKLRLHQAAGEILHDGYRPEVMEAKGKLERNLRLYEKQILDTPDDVYVLYKYGDFLRRLPDREDHAHQLLERAFTIIQAMDATRRKETSFAGEVCALLGLSLLRGSQVERALEVTQWGVTACRVTGHLWYAHGCALQQVDRHADAASAFRACRATLGQAQHVPTQPQIAGLAAPKNLSRSLMALGEAEEAEAVAFQTSESHPADEDALRLWLEIATRNRNWSPTVKRLTDRLQAYPDSGVTWLLGGELLFRLQLFDRSLTWALRASEKLAEPESAFGLAGESLLAVGHYENAVQLFSRGVPGSPRCRAGIALFTLAYGVDPADPLDVDDRPALGECRRMIGNLRRLGHDRLTRRLHDAGRELEAADPQSHAFLEAALT